MADKRFFHNKGPIKLSHIVKLCGVTNDLTNDLDKLVYDVSSLNDANEGHLSFMDNKKLINDFVGSKASFCLVNSKYLEFIPKKMIPLVCTNPYKSFAILAKEFYPPTLQKSYISKNANISSKSNIGDNSIINSGVYIDSNVSIGSNSFIGSNTSINEGVIIGENTRIESNVTLSHCIIGNNVKILPGVRIGQDGFGFVPDSNGHIDIPQLGRVLVGDDVLIGANTAIDRGSGPDTIIGSGCRIDNLVHIAHNVILGKSCIVAGQVGIAGSTHVGENVMIAGQVGISGHLNIGAGSRFAVRTGIINDVPNNSVYGGFPGTPVRDWHRQTLALRSLAKKKGSSEDE